ncbi:YgjV family protein [Azospirillum thermophilum]|uniref:YgjV family protein n=1 Tax=Azospirillum thermophilum TaxID=2202148 RepID=A0A2S2CS95_9PROT|nr:YgjV family protein [Azospirillum thermophilum]AWK87339.1 hypothetical protein DEW08_14920 [Azospirillum thermophilum]
MIDAFFAAPLAHAIGIAGMLGGMAWPLFRGRVAMLLVQLVPSICFGVHFALLGSPTGALMNVLSGLQILAAIPLGSRPAFRIVYLLILPVIAAVMALSWSGLPSLFAAAGTALVSLSRYQTAVPPFRLFMLMALPCWFGHNFLVGSVPGMMSDSAGIIFNLWMLGRDGPARRPVPAPAVHAAPQA